MDETHNLPELLRDCKRELAAQLKRWRKTLEKQEAELREAASWGVYQHMADTLLATPGAIRKGMSEIVLPDIHTGEPLTIPLNPKCSSEKSAEILYKKARRGKRGFEQCQEHQQETMQRIETAQIKLEKLQDFLAEGALVGHEDEAMAFCTSLGSTSQSKASQPTKAPIEKGSQFRHYEVDGWHIFAGKTSTDNDELSTRFAKPSDLWFHAVGYAGSHVIIRCPKNSPAPPQKIIAIAGGIAIFFSKAKNSSYAEVHLTEARFVHKPRKSKPGLVVADRCKTVRMSPVDPQNLFK